MQRFTIEINGLDRIGAVNDILTKLSREKILINTVDFKADGIRFNGKISGVSEADLKLEILSTQLRAIQSVRQVIFK